MSVTYHAAQRTSHHICQTSHWSATESKETMIHEKSVPKTLTGSTCVPLRATADNLWPLPASPGGAGSVLKQHYHKQQLLKLPPKVYTTVIKILLAILSLSRQECEPCMCIWDIPPFTQTGIGPRHSLNLHRECRTSPWAVSLSAHSNLDTAQSPSSVDKQFKFTYCDRCTLIGYNTLDSECEKVPTEWQYCKTCASKTHDRE